MTNLPAPTSAPARLDGLALRAAERGLVPDLLVRAGIRHLLRGRLRSLDARGDAGQAEWMSRMAESPLAVDTEAANSQHYEVPTAFFEQVLGPRLKYSCCSWPPGVSNLAQAEEQALGEIVERAGLEDGQDVLDLGCGWGSLCLFLAERFPASRITGITNSRTQQAHVEEAARARGLSNVRVTRADVNAFHPDGTFDRMVSIEMLEHVRNWPALFGRARGWLRPDGRMFVHVFTHARHSYPFENEGGDDWMARHFFTGGHIPSDDLLPRACGPFRVASRWRMDGTHYQRTAEAWLERLDANAEAAARSLARGEPDGRVALQRWRMFFMSCAELWGYAGGTEWGVSQYLLVPR